MTGLETFLKATLAGAIFGTIPYLLLLAAFSARLRSRHAALWAEVGQPWLHFFRMRSSSRFSRFMWRREFRSLGDGKLIAIGNTLWILRVYILAVLAGYFVYLGYSRMSR